MSILIKKVQLQDKTQDIYLKGNVIKKINSNININADINCAIKTIQRTK